MMLSNQSKDAENSALITGINNILQNIQKENSFAIISTILLF